MKPRYQSVWSSDGPPLLDMQRAVVDHNGRTWDQHRLVVQSGQAGAVIIPIAGDQVGLIRIWRPTLDEVRLELPRGFGETEDAEETAKRELREETGLEAGELAHLGTFNIDTGLMPTPVGAFLARVDTPTGTLPTDGEADSLIWIPQTGLPDLLASGEIKDAISLAAIALWLSTMERNHP